jgi:hypothetical protein
VSARLGRALAVVFVLALVAPAAARASITVSGVSVAPTAPPAATHQAFTLNASFSGEDLSGLTIHLPAGLVGDPSTATQCTTFETTGCDSSSQVGTTTANGLPGTVYNLKPNADEPARLGISILGLIKQEATVGVRPDGGLDTTLTGLPGGLLAIHSLSMTLQSSFMTMPTSCAVATTVVDATGAMGGHGSGQASFTPTDCAAVPFSPGAAISVTDPQRVEPSGYTVSLTVPDGGDPRQAHVRRAQVVLPLGTTLSPGVAPGLVACTSAQFTGSGCPAASQIGTVAMATPLIGTLAGKVFFGVPANGAYPTLVAVDDHGIHLRLTGVVRLDQATGRITTVFDDLPQVPFTSFALTFQGGDKAVLANPSACGSAPLAATLTPWSGNAAKTVQAAFTVTGCHGAVPFRPALHVTGTSTAAGRPAGALSIQITRPDGDQDLRQVDTLLPPGLAGVLTGVPMCADAQAATGACPADTRLGSVTALVGSGGAPVTLDGTVYLTGPAEGGLAGLAIVIPGRVGPVDLGTVVARAGLLLRPSDGGVTVHTAPLPSIVGGVPVSIRSLTLRLDRPGFAVNPSGCDPRTVVANLTGGAGATATATAPYQATDCAGLPFHPALSATIAHQGPRGARGRPALHTVISIPPGQSSTQRATVRLPGRTGLDLAAITGVCTSAQAAADACPASSRIGTVSAQTPLLPVPLSGPVFLVQIPGALIPGLRLALDGPVQLRLTGALDLTHGITAVFDGIPDVPLSRFELTFAGGGPLQVFGSPCTGSVLRLAGTLTGHNGATASTPARAVVTGCPATASVHLTRGARPRLKLLAGAGRDAKRMRSVTVALPRGLTARRGGRVRTSPHARAAIRRHSIVLRLHRARRVTLRLGPGVLAGRPHGRFAVHVMRTNGRHSTVRPRTLR